MKTFTNHALGARGIRTKDGIILLDPGQSAEIDPKTIVGDLPDLGEPSINTGAGDAGEIDALKAAVADLTKQVEDLTKERDDLTKANGDLTKQVEDLTKPAKG